MYYLHINNMFFTTNHNPTMLQIGGLITKNKLK